MVRWNRWESGEVGPSSFIMGRGRRTSPRFHIFVSDVNQANEGRGGFKLPFSVKTSYSHGYSVRNIRAVLP